MTVIRMSVATVTASLAAEISLCAVIVYYHRLGRRKWRYNLSIKPAPGAGLMKTVINYASGKPSDPLRGYSYVHDSNLRQPHQIAATMHKMLSVTNVLA